MKTLSKIILEEIIRIALNEFDTTPNVTPVVQTSVNKKLANDIANAIINSTSWYNDREDDLVAAFKAIPNMQTYNEVNKIIKKQKQQNLASFIGSFIAKDENNVWIPVLKHLIKIKAPVEEFKKYYKKTRYVHVSSNKTVNDYIIDNSLNPDGVSLDDSGKAGEWLMSHIEEIVLVAVGVATCAYISTKSPNLNCATLIRIIPKTIRSARSGAEIAKGTSQWFKQIDRLFSGTGKYNKRQLIAAIKLGVSKGDIKQEQATIAINLLKNEQNINKILQMAKFQATLDSWTRSGKSTKGDALAIANLLPKHLREKWLPLLTQEENRLLGNITTNIETNIEKDPPIIIRSVKNFITSSVKLEPSVFDRWQKIYTKAFPETAGQISETAFTNYINKVIYLIKERNFTVERAIRSAQQDIFVSRQRSQKLQDLDYFIQNHNKLRNFPFYLRLDTFPSFKQWKADMDRVKFSALAMEKEYRLQRWLWQNQKG